MRPQTVMRCPECGHSESRVVDSRESNESVRRRRVCLHCTGRFTTYERVSNLGFKVQKRSGKQENFSVEKITRSIELACAKRSLPLGAIEQIVEDIHEGAISEGREHIETGVIGEMVLRRLKTLDSVAYLRFASVFRDFDSLERFVEEAVGLDEDDATDEDLQPSLLTIPGSNRERQTARQN